MKTTALFLSVLGLSLASGVSASMADYYVWKDGKTGVSLSYPDTWRVTTNKAPDDIITLLAPNDGGGTPECRVRVRSTCATTVNPFAMTKASRRNRV